MYKFIGILVDELYKARYVCIEASDLDKAKYKMEEYVSDCSIDWKMWDVIDTNKLEPIVNQEVEKKNVNNILYEVLKNIELSEKEQSFLKSKIYSFEKPIFKKNQEDLIIEETGEILFECEFNIERRRNTYLPDREWSKKVMALDKDNAISNAIREAERIFNKTKYNIKVVDVKSIPPDFNIKRDDKGKLVIMGIFDNVKTTFY